MDEPEYLATEGELAPCVDMVLESLEREFPYHATIVLASERDLVLPREATPAFFTCFDWHSAVHSHWAIARALRCHPTAAWSARARERLARSLTAPRLAAERAFLSARGREGFERPYGLAWILQLAGELRTWPEPPASAWTGELAALEELAASRLLDWFERLPWPVRAGEHSQSAFAMGLFLDWARDAGRPDAQERAAAQVARLYAGDCDAPVGFEPSGQDFLSPLLAEADLMRRILPAAAFAAWLDGFLPAADSVTLSRWLTPVVSPDAADGKFAHLNGLNLSRAWMLEGIVSVLPHPNVHRAVLARAAATHRAHGLAAAVTREYSGSHWLGSFAIYLLTRRGLSWNIPA